VHAFLALSLTADSFVYAFAAGPVYAAAWRRHHREMAGTARPKLKGAIE
jgi:hypothetical protein